MNKGYYLTKDGETFEETTLEEIGREVLGHDGREYKLIADYNLATKRPNLDKHFEPLSYEIEISAAEVDLHVYENSKSDFEIDISGEVELLLLAKVGQAFIDAGVWSHVPDYWQAYTEEGYQEELQWRKDNSDD